MTKRCPWCGEKLENPGIFALGQYRCRCCGKKSTLRRDLRFLWVPGVFAFAVILLTRSAFALTSVLLIGVSVYWYRLHAPLVRSTKKYVPVKTAQARLILLEQQGFVKKRMTFLEGQCFTVVFINENDEPLSKTLTVNADSVSFDDDELTVRFSFLPKCTRYKDFPKDTPLFLFRGRERLAKGILTSPVAFPRLDASELGEE